MTFRIAIDSGGTFTDGVLINEKGEALTAKAHTTPQAPDLAPAGPDRDCPGHAPDRPVQGLAYVAGRPGRSIAGQLFVGACALTRPARHPGDAVWMGAGG